MIEELLKKRKNALKITKYVNIKDRFEIQITVVAQGGIKFFFLGKI